MSHVYASNGVYRVELTATDAAGTSTTLVYTGQQVLRNGLATASATRTVNIGDALAYVSESSAGKVAVINLVTRQVLSTIAVGQDDQGLALTPDGTTLAVANTLDSTVSLIDTGTDQVTATIPLTFNGIAGGAVPVLVAATDQQVFVLGQGPNESIQSIDLTHANHPVTANAIPLPGLAPQALALSPGDKTLAVVGIPVPSTATAALALPRAVSPPGQLLTFSTSAPYTQRGTAISLTAKPNAVAVAPGSSAADVTDSACQLEQVQLKLAKVAAISAGSTSECSLPAVVLAPGGGTAYLSDTAAGRVDQVVSGKLAAPDVLPTGANPLGLAVTPDGATVLAVDTNHEALDLINAETGLGTVPLAKGSQPEYVAVLPGVSTAPPSPPPSSPAPPASPPAPTPSLTPGLPPVLTPTSTASATPTASPSPTAPVATAPQTDTLTVTEAAAGSRLSFPILQTCAGRQQTYALRDGQSHRTTGLPAGSSCYIAQQVSGEHTQVRVRGARARLRRSPAGASLTLPSQPATVTVTFRTPPGTLKIHFSTLGQLAAMPPLLLGRPAAALVPLPLVAPLPTRTIPPPVLAPATSQRSASPAPSAGAVTRTSAAAQASSRGAARPLALAGLAVLALLGAALVGRRLLARR